MCGMENIWKNGSRSGRRFYSAGEQSGRQVRAKVSASITSSFVTKVAEATRGLSDSLVKPLAGGDKRK